MSNSNSNNNLPTTDDQDAAALLMLFQSQSTSAPSPQSQPHPTITPTQLQPPSSMDEIRLNDGNTVVQSNQVPLQTAPSMSIPHKPEPAVESLLKEEYKLTIEQPSSDLVESKNLSSPPGDSTQQHRQSGETNSLGQKPNLLGSSSSSGPSHSRSNSGNNFSTSPGPAAAALAVNTNKNDSKKNPSNIKAMVAAAALAAAAATPFPLLLHEPKKQEVEPKAEGNLESSSENKIVEIPKTESENHTPPLPTNQDLLKEELKEDLPKDELNDELKTESKAEISFDNLEAHSDKTEAEEIDNILEQPRALERETTPDESSYYTDPDSGTIGCVCEYDHDDGFTIQCDRCYRWQHASCMGIKSMDEVPEFYLCYLCDKSRKVNKSKARETQRDFLMPTSKRKRLNSIDNEALRERVVQQVVTVPSTDESLILEDGSTRRKSSTAREKDNQTPTGVSGISSNKGGRKPKFPIIKKDAVDVVDDTELFANTKDGYKTVYFPTNESEFRNENTKHLFTKLTDLISSRKSQFPAITDYSNADVKRKLSKSKTIVKPFGENVKMRFPGFSRFSVNIEGNVTEENFVMEMIGEIQLKQDYIDNPFNHYNIWGVSKPKVFFIPHIPFVIDARYTGNESRFLRRSCNPSCEIKVLLMKDDNSIRFVVTPTRPLKLGQELTLPWDWDLAHPIHKIINGKTFDQLPDSEKPVLVRSIETVLNGCECACSNNNECYLYKVRKLLAYLYRSTRKVNIPTFGNSLSKYSDIYRQKDESYYIPIKKRLDDRHKKIISETPKEVLVANNKSNMVMSEEPKSEEKREFTIANRTSSALSELSADLLPYKYKISQVASTTGSMTTAIPRSDHSTSTNEIGTPVVIDAFPIPVPILKPIIMNRIPSVSAAIISSQVNVSTSSGVDSPDSLGLRPPVKKKMSLKDYMKSKKK